MPQPISETPQGLDGLVMGCLIAASVLIISILSAAALAPTLLVLSITLLMLVLYLQRTRKITPIADMRLSIQQANESQLLIAEAITNALPRAIATLNRDGEVTHANAAAKTMLSAEMVNRPIGAYLRNSELRPRLDRAFAGEAVPPLSITILAPTERVVDIDFSLPISFGSDHERHDAVFIVIADRTEANMAREKRADFLANASHELKTPIASLKGYIETLRGHAKDDPEARELFLGIMQDQTERMDRLVTDLLSLRKIESSEHIAPSQKADLCEALGAARDVLRPLAETRQVKLNVSLPSNGSAIIHGKTDECIQLFLNLMENAIKLSPKTETVSVTLDYLPEWKGDAFPPPLRQGAQMRRIVNRLPSDQPVWRAIVSDAGPGFSKAHLPRIGERFYRVAGDLPAQEKGTGLGLAIVKHVAMRHRAGLFVQSAHLDNPVHFGRDAGMTVKSSGTAFSVVFAAVDASIRETSP